MPSCALSEFHIRCVTLSLDTLPCAAEKRLDIAASLEAHIVEQAKEFAPVVEAVGRELGIPVVSVRLAMTPAATIAAATRLSDPIAIALGMDAAVDRLNRLNPEAPSIEFIGGYTALAHGGLGGPERALIASLPEALRRTHHVCASVNVGSTRRGIDLEAIIASAQSIKKTAEVTPKGSGCARLLIMANAPEAAPYMPGAFHGPGTPNHSVHVGIGGLGVLRRALEAERGRHLGQVGRRVQDEVARMARLGEDFGRAVAERIDGSLGVIDLSLAPTVRPSVNSVAGLIEVLGVERCGGPGTTLALAFLLDAIKKGGVAGSPFAGGLSGAFLPVSEDAGMIRAARAGELTLDKLEALTCVCSVGLDMIGLPGDTSIDVIAGLIADQAALGVINNKATAVRVLPVPNARPGDIIDLTEFSPLFGEVFVMETKHSACHDLLCRAGPPRVPPPYRSLTN